MLLELGLNLNYLIALNFDNIILFVVFKLDLDKPLEDQGPFAVILHKLTEIIARNDDQV